MSMRKWEEGKQEPEVGGGCYLSQPSELNIKASRNDNIPPSCPNKSMIKSVNILPVKSIAYFDRLDVADIHQITPRIPKNPKESRQIQHNSSPYKAPLKSSIINHQNHHKSLWS